MSDPPQAVTPLLYAALHSMYQLLEERPPAKLLSAVCDCLQQVPHSVLDSITASSDSSCLYKELYVSTTLVGRGAQPITLLNSVVETVSLSRRQEETREEALLLLTRCFSALNETNGEQTRNNLSVATKRSVWLQELMGRVHNICRGRKGKEAALNNDEDETALLFFLAVFSAAALAWSNSPALIALVPAAFHGKPEGRSSTTTDEDAALLCGRVEELLLHLLPVALENLLETKTFSTLASRILEWLLAVHGNSAEAKHTIKGEVDI